MRVESSAMTGRNINRAKTLSRLRTAAAREKNLLTLAAIAAEILELARQKQPNLLPQLAQRIKRLRKSLKLSQSQFGSRLNCSAMAVCRWERGQRPRAPASWQWERSQGHLAAGISGTSPESQSKMHAPCFIDITESCRSRQSTADARDSN